MITGIEGMAEIQRYIDDRGHNEEGNAVKFDPVEIFGESCISAVGDTVLSEVARTHVRGDDFQRAAFAGLRSSESPRESSDLQLFFPCRDRIALPLRIATLPFGTIEVEQTCL